MAKYCNHSIVKWYRSFIAITKRIRRRKVIGGLCFIETTLNDQGEIVQTSAANRLVFGEIKSQNSERVKHISKAFSGTKSSFVLSENITQDMWHKYLFITVMSGVTTLMRAPIGPIRESEGGRDFIRNVFEESVQIMSIRSSVKANIAQEHMKTIDKISYDMKSSMQRDMEKGSFIEGKHLQGYLLDVAREIFYSGTIIRIYISKFKGV